MREKVPDRADEGMVGKKPSNAKCSLNDTLTPTLPRERERVQYRTT